MQKRDNNAVPAATDDDWTRARRPDQKRARSDAILAAARVLIDESGVEKVTLSDIARRANLSKANCYRYFENREAILLAVALEETRDWTETIVGRLTRLEIGDVEAVTHVLVSVTLKRPRLCKLVATLWSVLEQNVSEAVVAEFKREFHQLSLRWTGVLVRALPGLSEDQAKQFARFFLLFTAGAWPASKPSPALERVLAREEFGEMKMNLESTLSSCASTLLRGMLGVAKKTRGPRT